MPPSRIMIIRHAEKPNGDSNGVSIDGRGDPESLTPLGWQRAGALARYFYPASVGNELLTPSVIFAAGIGAGSKSKRPIETVTPLVELMKPTHPIPFITKYLKDDHQLLIDDVLSRDGVVLIAWEHKQIPALIALIPQAPRVPQSWPDNRFDIVWILDRAADGWRFTQRPQLLLFGDVPDLISH